MDFGGLVLTMDNFLTSSSSSSSSSSLSTNNGAFSEHNRGLFGSSCLKHARSNGDLDTADLGFQKMARTEMKMRHEDSNSNSKYSSCNKPGSGSMFPGGTQMLSFSSSGKESSASVLLGDVALPYNHHYQHHSTQSSSLEPSYFRNGGNNGGSVSILFLFFFGYFFFVTVLLGFLLFL